jgi:hypothetical protein
MLRRSPHRSAYRRISVAWKRRAGGHRQTELLGRFEIDDQLERRRLFDGQISRLGAFEQFIDIIGGTFETLRIVGGIRHEAAGLDEVPSFGHGRESVLDDQVGNLLPVRDEQATPGDNERAYACLSGRVNPPNTVSTRVSMYASESGALSYGTRSR